MVLPPLTLNSPSTHTTSPSQDLREKKLTSEQRTKIKADGLGSQFVIEDPSHHMLGFFEAGHVETERESDLKARLNEILGGVAARKSTSEWK